VTSLWRNRPFVVLWSGRLVSSLGSGVSAIALPLLVLSVTGSPARAGLVAAANGAPYFILALPAGVAADRWNRRRILLACDAGRGAAWLAVAIDVYLGHPSLLLITTAAVFEGSLYVFHNTAMSAALPNVVSDEQLPAAVAQDSVILGTTDLLGPAVGGALFQIGRAIPFLTDAATYAVSIVSILALRRPLQADRQEDHRSLLADAREGWRFLWRQSALRVMSLAGGLGDILFAGIALVLIVTAQRRAHATPAAIGAIFAASAGAGMVGAVLGPRLMKRVGMGPTFMVATTLGALLFPLLIATRTTVAIGATWAANVAVLEVANVAQATFRLRLIPDRLRGRVGGLVDLVSYGGLPIGTALAGLSLATLGPVGTLALMAGARVVLTAWLLVTPAVRRLALA